MIKLTGPRAEVLKALALLGQGGWFQTELIVRQRRGDTKPSLSYRRATEGLLMKLHFHVPKLIERRPGECGYSWALTVAGKAVTETQLGVRNDTVLRTGDRPHSGPVGALAVSGQKG
jgi:hypothetical protein